MSWGRRQVLQAAALAPILAGCGVERRPFRSADSHADGYPTVEAVEAMSRQIARATDGRLSIETFSGGQLGSQRDTLEMAIFGGLDMTRVTLASLNPFAPATVIPNLPFVFRDIQHMRAAMDGAPGRKILSSLEPFGLIGLCFYDSGARSFYNRRGPIQHPDDLRGLKIRVQNSEIFVAMVDALGGNPTPMNFGEVYQALLQGVIDGAENNWPSYEATRHFEAAPFFSQTEHVAGPEVLVMSRYSWERLSPPDQDLIMTAARDSVPVMRELWDERVTSARQSLISAGVVANLIDDKAPFRERMTPVYDGFLTGELRLLLEEIQDVGRTDA